MDPLEYITLFRNLLYISESIAQNSLQKDVRKSLTPITAQIISDSTEFLKLYQKEEYSISEEERRDFQHKIITHHRSLDVLIEDLHLQKECSKCKTIYPATITFFYPNKKARNGLRTECKECYSKAKKEYYRNKVKI